MALNEFESFRLVGGTCLSLQLGHRVSTDIDLFTDEEYDSVDFASLDKTLRATFPFVSPPPIGGFISFGTSYFIGNSIEDSVKLDLFYTDPFVFPCIIEQNIRFSSIEEIAAMKMEVVGRGGRMKDFWDIHEILDHYTLDEMISFYLQRCPYGLAKEKLLQQIVDFSFAEGDFLPNCLRDKDWDIIKLDLIDLVKA